jgi:hypothetical protein
MQDKIDGVKEKFTLHYVDGMDIPSRIDILERFGVCMETDRKPIRPGKADGYFGVWHEDEMIGVWYFTIVDGLVGAKRAHLLNWITMFGWVMERLATYMPPGYYLSGCRVRAGLVPHITTLQEGSTTTAILF